MKKLQIIAWTIFIIGLVFRLLHYPGTSVISILGTLLLVIHSILYLVKNAKTNLPTSFLHLSYSLLTVYLLFRLQYWSCGPMILGYSLFFIIVLLLTISCFVLLFSSKTQFKFPQIFLVVYFVFFFVLSFTHSDRIYYFFNLNTALNGESINTNYQSWDKYSWFLYIADKQDEAIEANQNAQKAVEEYLKIIPDEEAVQYSTVIKQHGQQIQDKNWTSWP
jgi:hypothetical protein